ncbi:hypothetical protein APHAL10511_003998 [Amanita phalloides]|nr:hypothetical protein APHAL10511_003998 [Amanita phalloides]
MLHPAEILPPEIIREIFKTFAAPVRLHMPQTFPWYLGHICASWRTIFKSMASQFWSRVDIDLHIMNEFHNDPESLYARYAVMLRMLQYFLNHTRGQPFSFQLKTRFHCLDRESKCIDRLLDMLVEHSPCWQDVYIMFSESRSHLPILYKAKGHLPLLHSLQLIKGTYDNEPDHIYDFFENAPRLKWLYLGNLSCWRINWSSLTILKIGEFINDEILLSILAQTQHLEKLAIYQSLDEASSLDQMTGLLNFPYLEVLTVIGFKLLSVIEAPILEELYIEDFDEMNMPHTIVTSFLIRSSCSLKRLGMAGCSAASLTDILRCAPNLVHLNLDNNNDLVMSFGQLTFYRQRRDKMPPACHLRSITIMDPGLSDIEIMELSSLLASRIKDTKDDSGIILVHRLQKLSIITLDPLAQYKKRTAVESMRQQCVGHGVDFVIQQILEISWPHHDNTSILDW